MGTQLLSHFSRVQPWGNLWTVACQAPLSIGFSRQEYWSELPFPSPGDLPDLGIEPWSPALQADSLPLSHQGTQSFFILLGLLMCMLNMIHNSKGLNRFFKTNL